MKMEVVYLSKCKIRVNKKLVISISLIILITTSIQVTQKYLFTKKQTPYEYLQKRKNVSSMEVADDFLYEVDMGNKRFAVFFLNGDGNLACAILKKGLFSYTLLRFSAGLPLNNTVKNKNYRFSSYQDGIRYKQIKWIFWGIIQDNTIEKVLVDNVFIDNKEATIVDIDKYDIRLWFLFGNNNIIFDDNIIKYIEKTAK